MHVDEYQYFKVDIDGLYLFDKVLVSQGDLLLALKMRPKGVLLMHLKSLTYVTPTHLTFKDYFKNVSNGA